MNCRASFRVLRVISRPSASPLQSLRSASTLSARSQLSALAGITNSRLGPFCAAAPSPLHSFSALPQASRSLHSSPSTSAPASTTSSTVEGETMSENHRGSSATASATSEDGEDATASVGGNNIRELEKQISLLKSQVLEKEKLAAQFQDAARRALADQENLRTRSKKEVQDAATYSISKFAKDLLSTADVLTMALAAVPESEKQNNEALANLYTGVSMTRSELVSTFKRHGIEEFTPEKGSKFDPEVHQALYEVPQAAAEGHPEGTIAQVAKTGYVFVSTGRVLRPADVGVVKSE